jgi:hypothetical protein
MIELSERLITYNQHININNENYDLYRWMQSDYKQCFLRDS